MPSVAPSALPPTATDTVRAVEIAEPAVAVTVTLVAASFSATLSGLADSVIACVSSSVSVRLVPVTVIDVPLPEIPMVSSPSTDESSVGVRVKVPVPLVALAAMVTSKLVTAA